MDDSVLLSCLIRIAAGMLSILGWRRCIDCIIVRRVPWDAIVGFRIQHFFIQSTIKCSQTNNRLVYWFCFFSVPMRLTISVTIIIFKLFWVVLVSVIVVQFRNLSILLFQVFHLNKQTYENFNKIKSSTFCFVERSFHFTHFYNDKASFCALLWC